MSGSLIGDKTGLAYFVCYAIVNFLTDKTFSQDEIQFFNIFCQTI